MNFQKFKLVITDFDGVWTDNKVFTDSKGNEFISCSKEDSLGLKRFKSDFPIVPIYVVSSESNNSVKKRCKKLDINYRTGCENKLEIIKNILDIEKVNPEETLYIGNDFNDLSVLKIKNLFIACPKDAHSEFKIESNFIIPKNGGNGAIRYIFDEIRKAKKNKIKRCFEEPLFLDRGKSMGLRNWGDEILLTVSEGNYSVKKLFIKKGSKGGLQYHHKKDETGFVISGQLLIRYINKINQNIIEEKLLRSGDCFRFKPYCIHQEEAIEDTTIIEVSTPFANDRVRVENLFNLESLPGLPSTSIEDIKFIEEYP